MTIKVNVKWAKEVFKGIEMDTTQPVAVFRLQLFSLTNVPPDRQKIMMKGKTLSDEDDLSKLPLKDGSNLMMMGTPDEKVLKAPEQQIKFVEDLPPELQAAATANAPAGLENVGNTCYLNSTVQCLRAVPELTSAIAEYRPQQQGSDTDGQMVVAMKNLYSNLETVGPMTDPTLFNMVFRAAHPQFNEMERGHHRQQDAEEAWGALLNSLARRLPLAEPEGSATNLVDKLFGIEFTHTLKCVESQEEEPVVTQELTRKLTCHIDIETNFLLQGLQQAMKDQLTKHSPSLGRDAVYNKTSVVSKFPKYLTIQFLRFFFKQQQQERAKILRPVKFPRHLDLIELCSEETQRALRRGRAHKIAMEDKAREGQDTAAAAGGAAEEPADTAMDTTEDTELVDPGFSAEYELKAVLTHIGRTLDSGHYIGWVKGHGDQWWKFDDDKVSMCNFEEDILKLAGGGDWHTAYICLYEEIKRE